MSPEDLEDLFGGGDPFSDFFHDMFGRSSAGARGSTRTAPPLRGEDVEAETEISLEEAYSGTTRTVDFGDGRRIDARIPPGIAEAARVRAARQGGAGRGQGASLDLY